MTARGRLVVLAGCAVVALLTALYAAGQSRTSPPAARGSVFLGVSAGEDVAAYLARIPATLPPAGTAALALVQLADERPTSALPAGATLVEAVFRVDLPRVQTALRFEALQEGVPVATALDTARRRAAAAAAADASRSAGRPGAIAAAEATALADPHCPCVVALVVSGDGTALHAVAAAPGVRAVEAGPPGATLPELALSPLLPGQTVRADPLPDDAPMVVSTPTYHPDGLGE